MTPLHIINGNSITALRSLPDQSAQCCVTSPPYWGLRSYLPKNHPDKAREIGQEPTPEAFVETMVQVFREVRRVLHDSGTLWLNLGDSYTGNASSGGYGKQDTNCRLESMMTKTGSGLKPKDLCMMPWRVALALQADGWWLRSVIVWHKKSCMPESVTDRPTNSWEPIFLLAKSAKYFYDAEAVKEPVSEFSDFNRNGNKGATPYDIGAGKPGSRLGNGSRGDASGRNQRNVWTLGPEPYSEAHFATFPTEIPRRAILAGTSAKGCCPKCFAPWERVVERHTSTSGQKQGYTRDCSMRNDGERAGSWTDHHITTLGWQPGCKCNAGEPIPCTVLDPFGGSGTTGQVALELGRRAVLVELNPDYVHLIHKRCTTTMGLPLAV
jgi:DNA modification methylase